MPKETSLSKYHWEGKPADPVTIQVIAAIVVFALLLVAVWALKAKADKSFTFRVFTALGLGVLFGVAVQLVFGLAGVIASNFTGGLNREIFNDPKAVISPDATA